MKRNTARELAVRLCYALSENPLPADEILEQAFDGEYYETLAKEDELYLESPGKQRAYIEQVVRGISLHNAELDEYVMKYAVKWDYARISRTAVAVMKVAMYEILYMPDVPTGVSVNEAVELAKKYEEDTTVSFVNGILGAFVKGETGS